MTVDELIARWSGQAGDEVRWLRPDYQARRLGTARGEAMPAA